MSSISVIVLLASLSTLSFLPQEPSDLISIKEVKSYLSIRDDQDIKLSSRKKVFFDEKMGYFQSYSNEKDEIIGSLLIRNEGRTNYVEAYYYGDFQPFDDEDELVYCASPLDFFDSKKEAKEFEKSLNNELNPNLVSSSYSLYDNHSDASKYFKIDLDRFLKKEAGSTYYEGILKEVPNYMNTMYNHKGCSPTTAAMYFAFIDRASDEARNLFVPDMPLSHTQDMNRVNNLIKEIGDKYFFTTSSNGTYTNVIASQTAKFLNDRRLYDYKGFVTNQYDDFFYAINYAGNPCHLSIPGHSMLGIGTKDIWGSPTNPKWVTCQAVYNDTMATVGVPATKIVEYYLIHW